MAGRTRNILENGRPDPARSYIVLSRIERAWNAAARTWDADALAELYDEKALLFGGRPAHSVGRGAIRKYFQSYEGTILSAVIDLFDQEIEEIGTDTFAAQGYCRFTFTLVEDGKTQTVLRATLVVSGSKEPCIRVHHFSGIPDAPPLGD